MYWSPERIRWIPASDASWPVLGRVAGLMPADFMAAIAPPAMSSLAPYTPANPLLPTAVIACCASFWALAPSQPGVSYCLAIVTPAPLNTLRAPDLNRWALLSAGSPLIMMIGPLGLPIEASLVSKLVAWSLPTRALSNEMYAAMSGLVISRS